MPAKETKKTKTKAEKKEPANKLVTASPGAFGKLDVEGYRKRLEQRRKESPLDPSTLYEHYLVTIELSEKVYGGMPKNRELIKAWVAARTGFNDELTEAQTAEHLETMTEGVAEGMWTGFPVDATGIFIHSRQIKAMLREGATMLNITKKKRGSKQVIQHGFEVKNPGDFGQRHYFSPNSREPDGSDEGPIHVQTAKGPRTALKRQDFVEGRQLTFAVWVLSTESGESRHLGENEIVSMLRHAQENGLGASRSQGNGKFVVKAFAKVA